jgi:hypothetical protein
VERGGGRVGALFTTTSPDVFRDSQTDSEDEEEKPEKWVGCDGFTDEAGVKKCKVGNKEELHDSDNDDRFTLCLIYKLASGEQKHFYKTSHLMRYLIKFHTTKGRNK